MTTPAVPPAAPAAPEAPEAPPVDPAGPPAAPKRFVDGFPEGKSLEQMTDAERAVYWQNYARKHEDTVKAFNGLNPQQIKDLQTENDALKTEKLSADDKALKVARDEAAKAARDAAQAEYLPQIQKLQVQGIAASVIQGDKLNAFMALVNPAALLDDKGAVDETKVMGYLTAMYGDTATAPQTGPRHQNFGQFSPPPPPAQRGAGGAAEAAKRFGTKTP